MNNKRYYIIINLVLALICSMFISILVNAQQVAYYKVHNCYGGVTDNVNNRIKSSNIKNDTLFVELQFVVNCVIDSTDQLYFTWLSNDTLLFDFIPSSKLKLLCLCDLQLDLAIINYKSADMVFMYLNKYINVSPYFASEFPITYDIYKGDTINYMNRYGYPEGLHVDFSDNGTKQMEKFYSNGSTIWIKFYNKREKLEEFCLRKGTEDVFYTKREYKKHFMKMY